MRVIMTGGGTGGHVYPALAIANKIKEMEPDSTIEFVGTSKGIENKLVPKAGYKLHHVEMQGLKRSLLSIQNIKTAQMMVTSLPKSIKILKKFKPDIVIGTGGYACWSIISAAHSLGIPTALHESNALPGVTVKMLSKKVDRVYVNFKESISLLPHPERAIRVGNPLRKDFIASNKLEAREKLDFEKNGYKYMLLSVGGSLGAEPINNAVLGVMKELTSKHPEILHVHASGSLEYKECFEKFNELGLNKYPNIVFQEYIFDMPTMMAAADVVIGRAGAMTLSELSAQSKACVLIPSPYVADNHQYKNAKTLADKNAAILIEEKDCSDELLTDQVSDLLFNESKQKSMGEAINTFAVYNCTDLIYKDIKENLL